ncbi:MAG: sigma-54 dependent transcriptional regulator, partial [Sandaracinaceae bacterium]|nr:sigma-54 dependent transcriptional regulator [Sandaracinaceae bacterium]
PMQELADVVRKIAPSSSNVLIQGESGTGKEIVARAIHEQSPRADAPFVPVNASAIPENLVESYLFGHERGAFTGADRRRDGLFRTATGGTLFLDEIGELQPSLQAKLLRAVETKEILPVGADHGIKVDTRLVSATHRDLAALAREGRFRDDLLYRLSVVKVKVPPLRERVEDIPVLVGRFLAKQSLEQKKRVASVDPTAMKALMRYGWPGNVRELSNVIERAVLLADGETVSMADLPLEIRGESFPEDDCNLENALAAFERKHIASVLATCEGNRESAAKALGISPATLYRRLEKLDLKGYRGGPIAGA